MDCFYTSVIGTFSLLWLTDCTYHTWIIFAMERSCLSQVKSLTALTDDQVSWSLCPLGLSCKFCLYIVHTSFVFLSSSVCSSPRLKNKLVGVRAREQIDSLIRCLSQPVIRSPTLSGWGKQLVWDQISECGEKIFSWWLPYFGGFNIFCLLVLCGDTWGGVWGGSGFFFSHKGKGRCTFPLLKLQFF